MTLFIQDGRRGGHLRWAVQAIGRGVAGGVIISPFHTPRVQVPRHQSGESVVGAVREIGGEALFDASTHARLLPTSDDRVHYDTWQLWGPAGIGLDTDERRLEHLERVFDRQRELPVHALAPTMTLDSPAGEDARRALRTAELARGLDRGCWQSVAARRSFWRAGTDLDAYVGQLAALRAPCWVLTVVNEHILDNAPDLTETSSFAGLLRTVHSLSQRSRVIVCYADYAGVPALAAGASDLGTGWDRGMRYFDPRSFQQTTAGIQIPASYVTQGGLAAVLRRDTGDAITRLSGVDADALRGGPMPADDTAERSHHLRQLNNLAESILAADLDLAGRGQRVQTLRTFYEEALTQYRALQTRLPGKTLTDNARRRWLEEPIAVLRSYAEAEQLW